MIIDISSLPHRKIFLAALFLSFFTQTFYSLDSKCLNDTASNVPQKTVRVYNAIRLTTDKPVINGILDDACWKTGEWAGNFTQWIPKEGAQPSQPTYLKILYDDRNIYVAIRACENDLSKIIRKGGRRDEFNGDVVGINFDSYHDHRTGFEFNVTAAGQKIDLLLTNPSNGDYSWNAVWYAKTGTEDSAWTVEYEIPLSQLRYSSDDEQVWGMHCWRWIDRLQEESDWEVQTSTGPGILYQFGELHGIKGLPQSRRIELMPYTVGRLKTFKNENGNPYAEKGRLWFGNVGLDAKIGLSSNFTADLTINPDFGQVEADPSVMNLTTFETFYDERRPFFLEGKNIFSFDCDDASLFYSRRIGHSPTFTPSLKNNEFMDYPDNTTILSAAKISGKTADGLAVGVLHSLTTNEHAELDSAGIKRNVGVEPMTNYIIARIQQDFREGNTMLGGIFSSTNRFINDSHLEYLNKNAFTGGIDLRHHWADKEFFVDAKIIGSSISGSTRAIGSLQQSSARYYQRPDANYVTYDSTRTSLSGYGGSIEIGKGSKGLWRYSTELNWRSPGLDVNDLGYMQTADIITQKNSLSYFVNQPVSIFRTYSLGLNQFNNWNFGIEHISSGAGLSIYLEFLNNWAVSDYISYTSEALDTRILRGGNAMLMPATWYNSVYVRTDPSKVIYFNITINNTLLGNNSGEQYYVGPGFSVMLSNTFKISMSYNYTYHTNKLQYVDAAVANTGMKYILGKIDQHTAGATFRIDYNITPDISIQYYGSPYVSTGKYSEFKTVTTPKAANYADRFILINPNLNNNTYEISEHNSSLIDYRFGNPDFNFVQFRSNLVFRWEYCPGSQIYLVWSQERTNYRMPGGNSMYDALSDIKDIYPENIFLVKLNYWFSL